MNLLKELSTLIEWQGPEPYITKRGKVKAACKGIPSKGFWGIWKARKEEIKALGVTLSFQWVAKIRETSTGLESRRGGGYHQTPKRVKAWEATLWISPKNTALLSQLGFSPPPLEEERDMERVDESIDALELVDRPF